MAIARHAVELRYRGRPLRLAAWFRDSGPDLLLFVHGLGCSKGSWRDAWSASALYRRSLLAFDLPGFGESPRPRGFGYDLAEQAELLAGIIDAHASRRICLVAHSMGGAIAALLPPRAVRRIDGLVLVEGRLVRSSCGIAAETADVDAERFATETYPRFRRRVASDSRAAFDLARADDTAFYRSGRSMIRWTDGEGLVSRVTSFGCPIAFVYGAENRHLDEVALLPSDCLLEVAESGHFVMNDNPGEFYPLLDRLASR